jgi:hypothetical protein
MPQLRTARMNCHCTSAVTVGAMIQVEHGFDPGPPQAAGPRP